MIVEGWDTTEKIQLDFSKNSSLSTRVQSMTVAEFEDYLFDEVLKGKIGVGGYLEERNLYERSEVFKSEDEYRSIHLGIDVWTVAERAIYAPIDCELHSYANNNNQNDYGGTIVLTGKWEQETIHLLFGHLSLHSLQHIQQKQHYRKGDVIGWLGNRSENGGWPPHLHFQLIKDMQEMVGDYPGVCKQSEQPFYEKNCPNPIQLIK